MKQKYTYKVIKKNKDPLQQVIEKSGITAEFTMIEMDNELMNVEKMIKQLKGQLKIDNATAKNIETHHPEVKQYTPKLRSFISQYDEVMSQKKENERLLGLYKDAEKEIIKEKKVVALSANIPTVVNVEDLENGK